MSREINKIKGLVSEATWTLLQNCNAVIAGGALTSVFCNREVKDIDVYFRNEEDFLGFLEEVFAGGYVLRLTNYTQRSLLFVDGETGQDVQVIIYKWFPTVESIFKDFDYTINMGAIICCPLPAGDQLVLDSEFLKHNAQRYLQFNTGTAYPLISALRVNKYVDRGYTISKPQYLRLMMTISQLNLTNWEEVKDHVGGMYGWDLNDLFPESEPFSLDKAIEILDGLEPDTKIWKQKPTDLTSVMVHLFGTGDEDISDRYFKWVRQNEDGTLASFYAPDFKYVVGKTVNGRNSGIYFKTGYDVLNTTYSDKKDGVLLELRGTPKEQKDWYKDITLQGDVEVVAKYTKVEFLRKFKKPNEEKKSDPLKAISTFPKLF